MVRTLRSDILAVCYCELEEIGTRRKQMRDKFGLGGGDGGGGGGSGGGGYDGFVVAN